MGNLERLKRGDNLVEITNEIKSLDRILVRPFHNGIYTPSALRQTCVNLKVPRRGRANGQK